ncbi:MAG: hypothetical protein U1E51_32665, partial [Candidatus Binatia bacterium]|nr:hypothetical protein [Candidatus Binatia bacterium]
TKRSSNVISPTDCSPLLGSANTKKKQSVSFCKNKISPSRTFRTKSNFEVKSSALDRRGIRAAELYVYSSRMEMRCWPRKPRFPIIVDTGRGFVGALSGPECAKRIAQLGPFGSEESMPVVDATAEGFGFYSKMMLISPIVTKKRWTKTEVIALYNDRKKPDAPEYRPVSLSNRGFDRVVYELVELLREP